MVTILVITDDEALLPLVQSSTDGVELVRATKYSEVMQLAVGRKPDLVLIDTDGPGLAILDELRDDFRTAFIPAILVTTQISEEWISSGDDYVTKPLMPDELRTRIRLALARSKSLRGLNPLTGLAGNNIITERLATRLAGRGPLACLYMDLDNFKAYNDKYGFTRGDDVINLLAKCILDALEKRSATKPFAGHVGGDDFVVLCDPDDAESIASEIGRCFDEHTPALYDAAHTDLGWVEVTDRQGRVTRYPVTTVSTGIVIDKGGRFTSAAQVSEVAAEVKALAKRTPGSTWATDRRDSKAYPGGN